MYEECRMLDVVRCRFIILQQALFYLRRTPGRLQRVQNKSLYSNYFNYSNYARWRIQEEKFLKIKKLQKIHFMRMRSKSTLKWNKNFKFCAVRVLVLFFWSISCLALLIFIFHLVILNLQKFGARQDLCGAG